MDRRGGNRLIIFLCFLFASSPIWGEDGTELVKTWITSNPANQRYSSIERDLIMLCSEAEEAGIPAALLIEKCREGSAKRIPPGRLLTVIQEEQTKLHISREIISAAGYPLDVRAAEAERSLKIASFMLQEGIHRNTIGALLKNGYTQGLPLSTGISSCSAVLHVAKLTDFGDTDLIRLGNALYKSALKPSNYDAVSSVFVKGRINRLSEDDILDIAVGVFSRGGGLIRLERELNSRIRR